MTKYIISLHGKLSILLSIKTFSFFDEQLCTEQQFFKIYLKITDQSIPIDDGCNFHCENP